MKKEILTITILILLVFIFTFSIVLAQNFCPECGKPHNPGDKFCPSCGYKFEPPGTEPANSPLPEQNTTQAPSGTTELVILSQEPFSGPAGTMVKLTAKGIDVSNTGKYKVEFNGVPVQVMDVKSDALWVTVPEGATTGSITVYVNGAIVLNSVAFFSVTGEQQPSSSPTAVAGDIQTTQLDAPTPVFSGPPTPVIESSPLPQYNLANIPTGKIGSGKIVYCAWEKTKYQDDIYVMKAGAGGNNITRDKYFNTNPCWAPGGKQIAFTSTREGNKEIYKMSYDGSNIKNLTKNPFWDDHPSWSSDGKKIAFDSWRDGNLEIYIMSTDGSRQVNITKSPKDDITPSWSPDCSKIAFSSNRSQRYQIYVMKSDGSSPVNISKSSSDDNYPRWSPDGKKIVFSSTRDQNEEIYVMTSSGSNQINLSKNAASNDSAPCWSPDGKKIAFMSNRSTSEEETYWEICVMNADGSNMINITNNSYWDGFPYWIK